MSSAAESHLNNVADGFRGYSRRQMRLVGTIADLHSVRTALALPSPPARLTPFQQVIDSVATPATRSASHANGTAGEPSVPRTAVNERSPSVFDALFAAVTAPRTAEQEPEDLPPPSRFMVRVAPLEQPHRKTKRNYDYFQDLDEKLASAVDRGLSRLGA